MARRLLELEGPDTLVDDRPTVSAMATGRPFRLVVAAVVAAIAKRKVRRSRRSWAPRRRGVVEIESPVRVSH